MSDHWLIRDIFEHCRYKLPILLLIRVFNWWNSSKKKNSKKKIIKKSKKISEKNNWLSKVHTLSLTLTRLSNIAVKSISSITTLVKFFARCIGWKLTLFEFSIQLGILITVNLVSWGAYTSLKEWTWKKTTITKWPSLTLRPLEVSWNHLWPGMKILLPVISFQ